MPCLLLLCSCLIRAGGRFRVTELRVGVYKCPGLPHQWCKTLEQRQANPLSHCAVCMLVCMCVCMCKKKKREGKTDEERHWSRKRDRFRLRAALKSVYSLELSPGRPAVFLPITSTSLLWERTYIIQLHSLSPPGPIEPLTNTLTYLNSHIDPLQYWSIICLDPLRFPLVCTLSK